MTESHAGARVMVDESETEFVLPRTRVDAPLSAEEVLVLIRDTEPTPAQTWCRIGFQSYFNPELESLAAEMGYWERAKNT